MKTISMSVVVLTDPVRPVDCVMFVSPSIFPFTVGYHMKLYVVYRRLPYETMLFTVGYHMKLCCFVYKYSERVD